MTLEWNLSGADKPAVHKTIVQWLMDENGWDDPFLPVSDPGRSTGLDGYYLFGKRRLWLELPLATGALGLSRADLVGVAPTALQQSLKAARSSVHTAVYQRDSVSLLWNG